MADQLQLRGGTTTEHATFTGALREVTVDTDKDTVVVHDNATAGGHPLLREDLSNLPAGTIDNADINANAAIDLSKLATGALPTAITVASANIVDGTIVNADVSASAAIAGTKISPNFGSQNVVTTGDVQVKDVVASGDVQTGSINGGPLAGMRNAIINGNFDIWQRGTSFTGNEFGADRWFHRRIGTTHTTSRQAFTLGQTDVPNEPTYFCRTVVTSVAGASNIAALEQQIESVRTLANQQVTVSFWAKADATKNIAVEMLQNFGTTGSPSASVTGIGTTKVSVGTSWQKITVTANLPSISGKTLGSDNNDRLALVIWFDAGSDFNARTDSLGQQSGTFDIAQVQVEAGPVATPFERRPIGTELALCQRYYEKSAGAVGFGTMPGSTTGFRQLTYYFKVEKRATPSVTTTFSSGTTGVQNITTTSAEVLSNVGNATADALCTSVVADAEL